MGKRRILFVDDEKNILHGLQRMLHAMRRKWEMAFVASGQDALDTMSKEPFDVIVADMTMPGMDGIALLREVMKRYPHVVRFVLSGETDQEEIFRSIGPTHQFLAKPCDSDELKSTVDRAFALRELLTNQGFAEFVSKMNQLPCVPELYREVMEELQSPNPSVKKVSQIIESDVGMSAKILQLVNSAFFGIRLKVHSPSHAVILLGLETVRGLVLMACVFSESGSPRFPGLFLADALAKHSIMVGSYAREIAKKESASEKEADEAFTAGLLHDVGKLVLARNFPEQYRETLALAQGKCISTRKAEKDSYGFTHAQVGAYLLGLWGLPDLIVEAVAFHHNPIQCLGRTFAPLTAVHVANALEREKSISVEENPVSRIDLYYLKTLGLKEKLSKWRDLCNDIDQQIND